MCVTWGILTSVTAASPACPVSP